MKFGEIKVTQSAGAILAHSLALSNGRLRKGQIISQSDIALLQREGIKTITAAQLETGDIDESRAAKMLASDVTGPDQPDLRLGAAFTGRVNIIAVNAGVFTVDTAIIQQINRVTADITLATLANKTRVAAGAIVATIKIIPYGLPLDHLRSALLGKALGLHRFQLGQASLVLTRTKGMKSGIVEKGRDAVISRLKALQCVLEDQVVVPHETIALAAAIKAARHDVILVLTGSATSDIRDVGPSAVKAAGGEITRFGMPVDPGNLLFLGKENGRIIIGLPGCARSMALNGADWVLERIACGMQVTADDIAAMGVGGLLKEIPSRPQPRRGRVLNQKTPKIEVILLAAGGSRRMRGGDKLLEDVAGMPMLRHAVQSVLGSNAQKIHVVLQPQNPARNAAIAGLNINKVESPHWEEGMAASLRAGINALSQDCDGVVIALADMPDITKDHINRLISAFDPAKNHEICRANTANGAPGLPVLFGARFFETLAVLQGDRGARDVIATAPEFLQEVPTPGKAATVDLDTPEDWQNWHKNNA